MRVQSSSPQLHHTGLDVLIPYYMDRREKYWDKMVKVVNSDQSYYRVQGEGLFAPALPVDEGTTIMQQNFQMPFQRDYTPVKRGIGFSVSTEALETDQYGYLARRAPKMAKSIVDAQELDIANFMNLATSTAETVCPDGLALASAAHLLESGTFSNILTGNPVLSVASLEAAIAALQVQPDHVGMPYGFMTGFDLYVHPNNASLANRLAGTDKYPTTNDNDINWPGRQIRRVIASPFFTSTTAFALVACGEDCPLWVVNRRALKTDEDKDIDVDGKKYTATAIWVKVPVRGQGFVYSSGAGS